VSRIQHSRRRPCALRTSFHNREERWGCLSLTASVSACVKVARTCGDTTQSSSPCAGGCRVLGHTDCSVRVHFVMSKARSWTGCIKIWEDLMQLLVSCGYCSFLSGIMCWSSIVGGGVWRRETSSTRTCSTREQTHRRVKHCTSHTGSGGLVAAVAGAEGQEAKMSKLCGNEMDQAESLQSGTQPLLDRSSSLARGGRKMSMWH